MLIDALSMIIHVVQKTYQNVCIFDDSSEYSSFRVCKSRGDQRVFFQHYASFFGVFSNLNRSLDFKQKPSVLRAYMTSTDFFRNYIYLPKIKNFAIRFSVKQNQLFQLLFASVRRFFVLQVGEKWFLSLRRIPWGIVWH